MGPDCQASTRAPPRPTPAASPTPQAYALVEDSKDSFGREALDTLVKLLEDNRDDIVAILAGYPHEMKQLMQVNPGLASRFPTTVTFHDYSAAQLMAIADKMLAEEQLVLADSARAKLMSLFAKVASVCAHPTSPPPVAALRPRQISRAGAPPRPRRRRNASSRRLGPSAPAPPRSSAQPSAAPPSAPTATAGERQGGRQRARSAQRT